MTNTPPDHHVRVRLRFDGRVAAGIVVLAVVALGLLGAPATARASACYPGDGRLRVTVGQTTTTSLQCVDGSDAPAAPTGVTRDEPAPGLVVAVGATNDGRYELRVTAAAGATPDSYNFPVVVTLAGGEVADLRLVVEVVAEPTPVCSRPPTVSAVNTGVAMLIPTPCTAPGGVTALEVLVPPKHGSLRPAADGLGFTYLPSRGFVGADRFTFRATNGSGSSPQVTVVITVRTATVFELSAAYAASVCRDAPVGSACRPGNGRRTAGGAGTGKVSHRHWPRVIGVIISARAGSATLRGGSLSDELLGHHGSDRLFGGAGADILWGDQDPFGNTRRQSDVLSGGSGRDFIYTSHGRNTVRAGSGNDHVWAYYGHGTVDCGPGIDTVRVSRRAGAYRFRNCERRGTF